MSEGRHPAAAAPPGYGLDPRDVFLRGQDVWLRALTEADVLHSGWYGWFNDEETTRFMQKHYYPNTREEQLAFWRALQGNPSKLQLGVVKAASPDRLVGCISLTGINHINRQAEIATVMGEPEGRDIRTYLQANQLLIRHGFDALNLNRIYGGTIIREVADTMCRVIGFQREGIARSAVYKQGRYHDVYLIGLLRDEFKG